jgi:hypothetical protein
LYPELGPQAVGVSPALALIKLRPANQDPIAICRNVTSAVFADDVASNAAQPLTPRVCGAANSIGGASDINFGSNEPDTAEYDTLQTIAAGSYVRRFPGSPPRSWRALVCGPTCCNSGLLDSSSTLAGM